MKSTLIPIGTLLILCVGAHLRAAAATPSLSIQRLTNGQVQIVWPSDAANFSLEQTDSLTSPVPWRGVDGTVVSAGGQFSVLVQPSTRSRFYRLRGGTTAAAAISQTSPAAGEAGVAVTRETILRFSEPLAEGTSLSVDRFQALFGGRSMLARTELSSDRRTATLFYLENLPASATITVRFDGNGIRNATGILLDADGDGTEGGVFTMQFNTLGNTPLDGTGVIGQVFASEIGPGGTNRPLKGVTITVDGAERTLRALTDATGFFHLYPSPAGRFFVHIDGRTAEGSAWPNGAYYPTVGKAWEVAPGQSNNLAGGTGKIFLPLIPADALQPVSASVDTVVKFSSSVVSTNPAFADVAITVPANALFSDNGTRGGRVGLAPVPPDRLPEPLPPGLEMPIVITVQTDGPLNFDRPAPVCFPNLPDPVLGAPLAPGTKQALISFNHDKGQWEAVGTMTVSADGTLICSDPGSGILQPGWHGTGPQPVRPKPKDDDDDDDGDCNVPDQELLEACLKSARDLANKCRKNVTRNLHARLDRCNKEYPPPHVFPIGEAWDRCVRDAQDEYSRNLDKCDKREEDMKDDCSQCNGNWVGGLSVKGGSKRQISLAAAAPSIDDLVDAKFDELLALLSQEPHPAPNVLSDAVQRILDNLDALTGNDVQGFLLNAIIRLERENAAGILVPLLDIGSLRPYPVKYVAHVLRPTGDFYIRGQTEAFLNYQIFVPRDGALVAVDFYDPVQNRFGHILPEYRPEAEFRLPRVLLHPVLPDEVDTDGDGLVDFAEHVYGTDAARADTDGDGILDGAEAQQGTNPLDGVPMGLGPIASVLTLGSAVDVAALNNLAVVAEGAAGVSVFDTRNSFNPVRVAQVDTPGDARAVAMEGTLAAVADGNAGLAILNLAAPNNASIIHQVALSGDAVAVAVADSLAYVGLANGRISVVEMTSGQAFETMLLGANSLSDVLIVGDVLYVLAARTLFAFPLDQGTLQPASSVASPGSVETARRTFRLAGGGDLLYAANGTGFNVFSLADPLAPVFVQRHTTTQVGWKQIVPNGSGLGVAAVGINAFPDDVYLHDLNPGGTNGVFLTRLVTPGIANALSIYNGLAYVADGANGLMVLNYTEADTMKIPPQIGLSANFPLGTNSQAPSASPMRVRANVSDDVQVRNVEFYGNGRLFATDGNFPFEVRFMTPLLTATNTNFTIQARAFDTGGNSAWSELFTVNLVADSTPPKVRRVSPTGGGRVIDRITAYFTEAVDAGKLNSNSFQILSAGADGQLKTADDLILSNASYSVRADNFSASALFPQSLPDGLYRVTLTTGITDGNNNPLSPPLSWDFRVGTASFWTGPFTGSWQDPANWSTGVVPGTNDNVVVDVSYGTGRIVIEEPVLVGSLELFEELEVLRGASLEVIGNFTAHRDLIPNGGIIRNTVINLLDGSLIQAERGVGSTLQNVTVNGNIVSEGSDWLQFLGRLTLNGTLTLSTNGGVIFGDVQMTNGTIQFAGNSRVDNASVSISQRTTAIWGPGVVVRGRSGTISGAGTLINQGKISADQAGEHIWVHPGTFTHDGTAEVINGAQLTFGTSSTDWNGAGSINVLNGTFNLDGQFGPITTPITKAVDGTVRVTGNGNLQGSTLTLNAATGSWILDDGILRNGILNQIEGASLEAVNDQGVLEQMTVNGNLVLDNGSLNIRSGLALNGTLLLGTNKFIRFVNSQTMTNGTIEFAGPLQGTASPQIAVGNGITVTFGANVLVHGRGGRISGAGTLINQGKISADVAAGTIRIDPGTFVNQGIIESINGGILIAPGFP